jgi:hypothetical protein
VSYERGKLAVAAGEFVGCAILTHEGEGASGALEASVNGLGGG